MARLQQVYKDEVAPALKQQFGYKSVMEVPRITKITLNMGVGEAVGDKKILEHALGDMTKIAGQKPCPRRRASRSRVSRSVTATRSAAWSRCVVRACSSFSIA